MKQSQKSEQTKQIILDKSFKLFYENGFKSTSIDKIMLETKLTKGAFYHHFSNKKEVGLAVINHKIQIRVYESMIAPLYQAGNALEIIRTTFIKRLNTFSIYDKQHGCSMNNFINEIADYEVVYQHALKAIFEAWKSALVGIIERGKLAGTINNSVSSDATASYLISSFEGIRGIRKLYNDDKIINEYIIGLDTYLNHLKA